MTGRWRSPRLSGEGGTHERPRLAGRGGADGRRKLPLTSSILPTSMEMSKRPREDEPARAIHASRLAAREVEDRPGTRARRAASAHTTAAPSKAKRKAGRKPRSEARAPKSQEALCTPATIPMVRERKANPPAAPCWRGGNEAMISARLGT